MRAYELFTLAVAITIVMIIGRARWWGTLACVAVW